MKLHKRDSAKDAFGKMCSARNLCESVEYLAQYDGANDRMMDTYIEKRRNEFYKEWNAYLRENCE